METERLFLRSFKTEDTLIGPIGYKDIDRKHSSAGFGIWIGKPYRGEGYATEAVKLLVTFGFNNPGLHRVYATPFGSKKASQRVPENAGLNGKAA